MSALRLLPSLQGKSTYLFDLDGVLTPTAAVHRRAWADLFTPYLDQQGVAPYTEQDYFSYIDGKARYDGVLSLLESRGLELPYGDPTDSPQQETVCGLGNRKNDVFSQVLRTNGVEPYPGSVAFLDALIEAGYKVAVVSASRNATEVLAAAGLSDRFEVVVDGVVAAAEGLPGKPQPDPFLHAAKLLGSSPSDSIVVEDAEAGVAAGKAGNFAGVVGVNRGAGADALRAHGATEVVDDLGELVVDA